MRENVSDDQAVLETQFKGPRRRTAPTKCKICRVHGVWVLMTIMKDTKNDELQHHRRESASRLLDKPCRMLFLCIEECHSSERLLPKCCFRFLELCLYLSSPKARDISLLRRRKSAWILFSSGCKAVTGWDSNSCVRSNNWHKTQVIVDLLTVGPEAPRVEIEVSTCPIRKHPRKRESCTSLFEAWQRKPPASA